MTTTLKYKLVTTKKEHRCHGCTQLFPAGTKMTYWAGTWEGDFGAGYTCTTCEKIMAYLDYSDGFEYGFVTEMVDKGETPEQLLIRLQNKKS